MNFWLLFDSYLLTFSLLHASAAFTERKRKHTSEQSSDRKNNLSASDDDSDINYIEERLVPKYTRFKFCEKQERQCPPSWFSCQKFSWQRLSLPQFMDYELKNFGIDQNNLLWIPVCENRSQKSTEQDFSHLKAIAYCPITRQVWYSEPGSLVVFNGLKAVWIDPLIRNARFYESFKTSPLIDFTTDSASEYELIVAPESSKNTKFPKRHFNAQVYPDSLEVNPQGDLLFITSEQTQPLHMLKANGKSKIIGTFHTKGYDQLHFEPKQGHPFYIFRNYEPVLQNVEQLEKKSSKDGKKTLHQHHVKSFQTLFVYMSNSQSTYIDINEEACGKSRLKSIISYADFDENRLTIGLIFENSLLIIDLIKKTAKRLVFKDETFSKKQLNSGTVKALGLLKFITVATFVDSNHILLFTLNKEIKACKESMNEYSVHEKTTSTPWLLTLKEESDEESEEKEMIIEMNKVSNVSIKGFVTKVHVHKDNEGVNQVIFTTRVPNDESQDENKAKRDSTARIFPATKLIHYYGIIDVSRQKKSWFNCPVSLGNLLFTSIFGNKNSSN